MSGRAARRFFRAMVLLALAAAMMIFLHRGGSGHHSVLLDAIWNFGHFPLFGSLALIVLWLIRLVFGRRLGLPPQYAAAFVLVTVAGALSEYLQIATMRDADPVDWLVDIAGAASFLAVFLTTDPWLTETGKGAMRRFRSRIRLAALAVTAAVMIPVFIAASATIERRAKFPLLQSFDSRLERMFVVESSVEARYAAAPAGWNGNASTAAEVTFLRHKYPTLHLSGPYPDWSGYETLTLEAFLPSSNPVVLYVSIKDSARAAYGDRYDAGFELSPGYNRVEIPLDEIENSPKGRRLDLAAIYVILLFVIDCEEPVVIWFDNVELQ